MNIASSGNIKYKVGDLVLTYSIDGDAPYLGMIIAIRHKLVHIEWYLEGRAKYITANGKSMTQLQRRAYLEYRQEIANG